MKQYAGGILFDLIRQAVTAANVATAPPAAARNGRDDVETAARRKAAALSKLLVTPTTHRLCQAACIKTMNR
jgi:hypothetical protein